MTKINNTNNVQNIHAQKMNELSNKILKKRFWFKIKNLFLIVNKQFILHHQLKNLIIFELYKSNFSFSIDWAHSGKPS